MIKKRLLVESAKNNGDAFRDVQIPQAAIDVKRIQIVLKQINHFSHTDI
jgi:hypothetical protein